MQVDTSFDPDAWAERMRAEWYPTWFENIAFALEKGSESGNDDDAGWHIQFTLHLHKKLRLASVAQLPCFLPENGGSWPHLEKTAKPYESWQYCSGQGGRKPGVAMCWSFGQFRHQSQGREMSRAVDLVRTGGTMRELAEEHPLVYVTHHRGFRALRNELLDPWRRERTVILLLGPTGGGKTWFAMQRYPFGRLWRSPVGSATWFDGYDGHDTVILDEFAGQYKLVDFLRLLHEWDEWVPCKGAHVLWCPSTVIITSNFHPADWYNYFGRLESYRALIRRISSVVEFPNLSDAEIAAAQPRDTRIVISNRGDESFTAFSNVQPRIVARSVE